MTYFIAEIGINHNGDLDIARRMIIAAKNIGCDAVKFQKRTVDKVYTKEYLDGPRESPWGTTQREQKEGLEFSKEEYDQIDQLCRQLNIDWFASPWDLDSVDFLLQYNPKFIKIASAHVTDLDFVEKVLDKLEGTDTRVLASTGMCNEGDVIQLINALKSRSRLACVMHCTSTYPTNPSDMNLSYINHLNFWTGRSPVGYSSHCTDILWAPIAYMQGARFFEFHVTEDKEMYGSDQKASLTFEEAQKLITNVKLAKTMLGECEKKVFESEIPIIKKLRG